MSRVVIIGHGQFPHSEYCRYLISLSDYIICCDGALSTLEKKGIRPDVVIGDMDSVCRRALSRYNGKVIHDSDQECNDQTKAVRYVLNNISDVETIHILATTGKSEAHTIGNLGLLMEYERTYDLNARGIKMEIVSDYCTAFAISDSCTFYVGEGRKVSIFTDDNSLRICSRGLKWITDNVIFKNWWQATLNHASEDQVHLELNHRAAVLIILD